MRKTPNAELPRLSVDAFKEAAKTPLIVVLDNVRSALNVGSIFRTCDAFLIEKIYLCGITAKPPNKDIHKTALGATDSVQWQYISSTTEAVQLLKKEGYHIFAIEQADESIDLQAFTPKKGQKYAIIFGHEVRGVATDVMTLVDGCIEIPQYGTKHSLNIAVSAGVVLWDLFLKTKLI